MRGTNVTFRYLDSRHRITSLAPRLLDLSSVQPSNLQNIKIRRYESLSTNSNITVQDFYAGKSVFLTGSTGYLGKVILEKLLYSCTKMDKIYLLIREKSGEPVNCRVKNMFEDPLFDNLNKDMPDMLSKVVPIVGDVTEPDLGIKANDIKELTEKVSVVIHSAASVRFVDPWDPILKHNYEGTKKILKLCHQIKKIEALVYISTAFAVSKSFGYNVIEEKVYPPPADIEEVYNFVKKYNKDIKKTKEFIGGLANNYAYSKALTEPYVAENHGNIPTCIVRPSIVGPKMNEPQIGWLDNWFGLSALLYRTATGWNRVVPGGSEVLADFIPVDLVANTCIVAAARLNKSKDIKVFNSCSTGSKPVKWGEAIKYFKEDTVRDGRNDFPLPFNLFTKSKFTEASLTFLLQILPAHLADLYLTYKGKETKYVKTQTRLLRMRDAIKFFIRNEWIFKTGNVSWLHSTLSARERRIFPCDPAIIDWRKYFRDYSQGVHKYLVSENKK